jgi:hypothetical protein
MHFLNWLVHAHVDTIPTRTGFGDILFKSPSAVLILRIFFNIICKVACIILVDDQENEQQE